MNFIVYVALAAIVLVPIFIIWDKSFNRGTKVRIMWSKFIDDREIVWNPHKQYFGYNRFNKDLNVEEFKLPKKMGGHIIEGLNPDDLEVTSKNYPIVHLVQIGEQMFVPKKREDVLIEWLQKTPDVDKRVLMDEKHAGDTATPKKQYFSAAREFLADKDVQGWAMMQTKYNNQLHADKKKGFEKYAALIVPAIAIMAALVIIVFAMNKAGDITAQANNEIRDTSGKLTGLVNNFINNQNSNSNNQPTDVAKPPAAQDSGGGTS